MRVRNLFLKGMVDEKHCIPALKEWFASEWAAGQHLPPSGDEGKLMLGFHVYGVEYVKTFASFCLPSLLAPANRETLAGRAIFVAYTAKADELALRKALDAAEKAGIGVEVRTIPDAVLAVVKEQPVSRYWLLGTVNNLCLQEAKRRGMAHHMLMPDLVYSEAFFANLFRLAKTHEAIAQTTISGKKVPCERELKRYRRNGKLSVPARELGDIAFRHMHPMSADLMMNGRDLETEMPDSHLLWWKGRDALHIFCCHLHPTYLGPALVARAPLRLFNAIDTELPAFMPDEVYVPALEDEMTFIELSGPDRIAGPEARTPITQWILRCAMTTHFLTNHDRFFTMRSVVPIAEQEEYAEVEEIEGIRSALHQAMLIGRPIIEPVFEEELTKLDPVWDEREAC